MMASIKHPCLILIFYFLSFPVMAEVAVEVIETYPEPSGLSLGLDQSWYVHLNYSSDQPVRIFVRPFTGGKEANAMSHAAYLLPAGSGETLGWFAMREPGMVDEYRVSYTPKDSGQPIPLLSVPVKLQWKNGGTMTDTEQPEWIARINQQGEALWKAERANAPQTSLFVGMLIGPMLFGIPLLALFLSVMAFKRWAGGWRYAGGLPLVLFGVWAVILIISVIRDPTSHNLWPFEMMIWASGTLVYLGVLFGARKLINTNTA